MKYIWLTNPQCNIFWEFVFGFIGTPLGGSPPCYHATFLQIINICSILSLFMYVQKKIGYIVEESTRGMTALVY
jgi:hypothetical protein